MKKYIVLFSLLIISLVVIYSCNKAAAPTAFSFVLDGNKVEVDSTYVLLYTYNGSSVSRRQIQIIAYSQGKQVMEILALAKLGAQPALSDCFITYYNNGGYNSSDVYVTETGGVNFSKCDTLENIIQGTFSVENAVNSDSLIKVITSGEIYIDKINR